MQNKIKNGSYLMRMQGKLNYLLCIISFAMRDIKHEETREQQQGATRVCELTIWHDITYIIVPNRQSSTPCLNCSMCVLMMT